MGSRYRSGLIATKSIYEMFFIAKSQVAYTVFYIVLLIAGDY